MVDTTKITAHPIGHMTYAQTPATGEQKHFSLISFLSASKKLLFDFDYMSLLRKKKTLKWYVSFAWLSEQSYSKRQ